MTNKKPSAAEVTDAIKKQWKDEYKRVMVWTSTDGKKAFFKNPDIVALDASAAMGSTTPIKSNILLAKACFLGGDAEVCEDPEYIIPLGRELRKLVVQVEGELTEL